MKYRSLSEVFSRVYTDLRPISTGDANDINRVDPTIFNSLAVTSFSSNVTYYVNNLFQPKAKVEISWAAPTVNSDNLQDERPVDYLAGYTYNVADKVNYTSTKGLTTVTYREIDVNSTVYFNVITVGSSGRKTVPATHAVTVNSLVSVINKPDVPTASMFPGGINVRSNWKDYIFNTYTNVRAIECYVKSTDFATVTGMSPAVTIEVANQDYYIAAPYGQLYVKLVAVDIFGNRSPLSNALSITVVKVSDNDISSLAVGKLITGQIAASTEIIAGDPTGYHAKMTATGFKSYSKDTDGNLVEVVNLGTNSDNVLSVSNGTQIVASINKNGFGSFIGGAFSSLTLAGVNLSDALLSAPRGLIYFVEVSDKTYTTSGWSDDFISLSIWLEAGRNYMVTGGGFLFTKNVVYTGYYECQIKKDGVFQQRAFHVVLDDKSTTEAGVGYGVGYFRPSTSGLYKFIFMTGMTGTYTVTASTAYPMRIGIVDQGNQVPLMNWTYEYSPPPTPEKSTYTSTWSLSGIQRYNGSGGTISGSSEGAQGYYSSNNGNQYTRLNFNATAISGQSVTLNTALTDATINKVELYLCYSHWYYSAGGTAVIYANTSNTTSGGSNSSSKPFSSWAVGAGNWVDITSIFSTSHRSIQVGQGLSTSFEYYGKFYGFGTSYPPLLKVTYTK